MSYNRIARDILNPGTDITCETTGDVAGKTFLAVSAARGTGNIKVATAPAGTLPLGVAKYDADAGELVGLARGHRVITVTAGGTIAAGAAISVGEGGKAVATTPATITEGTLTPAPPVVGLAVTAGVSGGDIEIALT